MGGGGGDVGGWRKWGRPSSIVQEEAKRRPVPFPVPFPECPEPLGPLSSPDPTLPVRLPSPRPLGQGPLPPPDSSRAGATALTQPPSLPKHPLWH